MRRRKGSKTQPAFTLVQRHSQTDQKQLSVAVRYSCLIWKMVGLINEDEANLWQNFRHARNLKIRQQRQVRLTKGCFGL
jgi:hypothetical protein